MIHSSSDGVPLTPKECVSHGGHCYVRTGFSRAVIPPQYAEVCKHCEKIRWAIPQHPFKYVEES